jgi:lipid-binding SYLF domain-containing protein
MSLIEKAQCVAIVPGVKKGAFLVGAEYGKGYFTCREHNGRGWTAPGAVIVEGGQFKLEADASVAAGPIKLSNKEIIEGNAPVPAAAQQFVHMLDRYSRRKNFASGSE